MKLGKRITSTQLQLGMTRYTYTLVLFFLFFSLIYYVLLYLVFIVFFYAMVGLQEELGDPNKTKLDVIMFQSSLGKVYG